MESKRKGNGVFLLAILVAFNFLLLGLGFFGAILLPFTLSISAVIILIYCISVRDYITAVLGLVIFLLGISIIMPAVQKMRESSSDYRCGSNMHQIYQQIELYKQQNGNSYPQSLDFLIGDDCQEKGGHLKNDNYLKCPRDKSEDKCSYVYLPVVSGQVSDNAILLYEKTGHGSENRRRDNVVYVNGEKDRLSYDELQEALEYDFVE